LLLMQRCRTFFCASLLMQRCRTFCASLLHAALSYSLRFVASCSVVVLSSALRCFMQRCRALYYLRFVPSCSVVILPAALRSFIQRCRIIFLEFCLD
jgi:hypothetical protein